MNIGELDRRITFYKPGTSTSDGIGGFNVVDGDAVTTWCSARPMNMKESLRYGLEDGAVNIKFQFYYEQGRYILQKTKLTYEGNNYRVISVIEIDENKDSVIVIASSKV